MQLPSGHAEKAARADKYIPQRNASSCTKETVGTMMCLKLLRTLAPSSVELHGTRRPLGVLEAEALKHIG